jgi:hypothetical protein
MFVKFDLPNVKQTLQKSNKLDLFLIQELRAKNQDKKKGIINEAILPLGS